MVLHVSSSSLDSESFAVSYDKVFMVSPGHAPIPAKLVEKITSGEFVKLVDLLLSPNLHVVNLGSHNLCHIVGTRTSY